MLEMPVPARAEESICWSDAGRHIDSSEKQPESASASIPVSFEPDSKENDESDSHQLKHFSPRNSTDAGRKMDSNDEQRESAFDSIRLSFDPDSNVNDESDSHLRKEPLPRNSTDAGRQIDLNDE
jgi:hypothetical protein